MREPAALWHTCHIVALRAVVFDYGGTLVTFDYPRARLLEMLETVRPWLGPSAPDAETLMRTVLEPLEAEIDRAGPEEVDWMDVYVEAWRRAGVTAGRDTLYRVLDAEQQVWDAHVRVVEGALETLRGLRARGLRTAVASNAPFPPEMMRRQMRGNGIAAEVDAIVLSSEIGRRKPAPELYRAALEELGVEPAQALYVGDRAVEDYEGPRAVGMPALICTQVARRPPPYGVPTIPRLRELLERL